MNNFIYEVSRFYIGACFMIHLNKTWKESKTSKYPTWYIAHLIIVCTMWYRRLDKPIGLLQHAESQIQPSCCLGEQYSKHVNNEQEQQHCPKQSFQCVDHRLNKGPSATRQLQRMKWCPVMKICFRNVAMFYRTVLRAMTKRKIRTSCAVFKMRVTRIMRKAWQGVTLTASSQRNWQVGTWKHHMYE